MQPDPVRTQRDSYIVGGIHLGVALLYWLFLDVSIVHDFGPDKWGWFSQNLATDLLLERAVESLWFLHTQPPLWNALGAVLIQTFGSLHMTMLQCLHIAMGTGIAVMGLHIVTRVTGAPRLALATGLILALHPAMFLFEAYALYTTACAFLIMVAALILTGSDPEKSRWPGVAFIVVISTLTMTRSVYHALLPLVFAGIYWRLLRHLTRRQVVALAFALTLPLGWYAKNQLQYGFFGTSSWYGIGLWRVALFQQDPELLRELYDSDQLHPVVTIEPFTAPSAYRFLGFDRVSDVPSLSRDDFQNINYPDISAEYREAALVLLRSSPGQYLRNVATAYGNFSDPSTRFAHLAPNRERIRWHAAAQEWILARPLFARLEPLVGGRYLGSIYLLLFPAVLLMFAIGYWKEAGGLRGLHRHAVADPAPLFMATLVAYTILVTCTMELGENLRFKFMIEPVFLTLAVIVLHRLRRSPSQ